MSKKFDWEKYEDAEEAPVNKFNWEDYADAESIQEPEAPKKSALDRAGSLLKSAGGTAASGLAGFGQGRANNIISLANLFNSSPAGNQFAYTGQELSEMPGGINIPHLDIREHLPEGGLNTAAFGVGDILGGVTGANKFGNQLKEFDPMFKGAAKSLGAGKYSGIGGDVLRGATAGAATQEDNRLLGGLLGGASEGAFGALSKTRALEKILKGREEAFAPAGKIYNEIKGTLEKAGKEGGIKAPNIDWETLGKAVPEESFAPIKKLIEEGTYSSLNSAQGELSKIARSLHKTAGGDVTSAYNAVKKAEKKIHGKLFERFNEVNPSLANKYQEANELYAKAIDKFDFDALKDYSKLIKKHGGSDKKLREKTLEDLLENPDFRLGLGKEYPEAATSSWNPLSDYLGNIVSKGLRKK